MFAERFLYIKFGQALEHEGQGEDARFLPSMMEALLSKQEGLSH